MTHADKTNYDSIAERYVAHVDESPFNKLYERPYMLAQAGEVLGKVVLDAGCGSGFYSAWAVEQGARVIAFDASEKMVALTRARVKGELETHVADLGQPLSFVESESVDLVICSLAIHYVEHWDTPVTEFYRVLKPGGRCLISTHHPITDYELFNSGRYHETRIVEDQWDGFGEQPLPVTHFVRKLTETLRPIYESGFIVDGIDEPLPSEACGVENPELHKRLTEKPAFLFFRLRKGVGEQGG